MYSDRPSSGEARPPSYNSAHSREGGNNECEQDANSSMHNTPATISEAQKLADPDLYSTNVHERRTDTSTISAGENSQQPHMGFMDRIKHAGREHAAKQHRKREFNATTHGEAVLVVTELPGSPKAGTIDSNVVIPRVDAAPDTQTGLEPAVLASEASAQLHEETSAPTANSNSDPVQGFHKPTTGPSIGCARPTDDDVAISDEMGST